MPRKQEKLTHRVEVLLQTNSRAAYYGRYKRIGGGQVGISRITQMCGTAGPTKCICQRPTDATAKEHTFGSDSRAADHFEDFLENDFWPYVAEGIWTLKGAR
jgi:hypothetical protein